MKYTAKIKQTQLVGKVRIVPKGGDLQDAEVKAILADPWGKELISKGMLAIETVKPSDLSERSSADEAKGTPAAGSKLEAPEIKISGDAKSGKQ